MKLILILVNVCLLSSLSAKELHEDRVSQTPQKSIKADLFSSEKLGSEWDKYRTDDCLVFDNSVQNEGDLRSLGLRRCKDGSISFIQPSSDGWNDWEGKCGQTAAVNTLFHYCQVAKDPDSYMDDYLSDITPGVRPGTLKRGLNKVFKKFKYCDEVRFDKNYLKSDSDFIGFVKQKLVPRYSHGNLLSITRDGIERLRQPVVTLIQNPGTKYLHWVTVVDHIEINNSCRFVVNHWDNQYTVPCKDFARWSYQVGKTYPIILRSYSVVVAQD